MTARTVHLMRHGVPVGAGLLLGHSDPDATADGIERCRRAAAPYAGAPIVSSDLIRARAAATALGGDIRIDARWRELNFGDWDGRDPATLDPAALAAFWRDPDAFAPPGGERWSALVTRVGAARAETADGTLVVTHAGAIRAALSQACGLDTRQVWAFALPYAAVVTLRLWNDGAQIVRLAP